jgi:hypothetical protein
MSYTWDSWDDDIVNDFIDGALVMQNRYVRVTVMYYVYILKLNRKTVPDLMIKHSKKYTDDSICSRLIGRGIFRILYFYPHNFNDCYSRYLPRLDFVEGSGVNDFELSIKVMLNYKWSNKITNTITNINNQLKVLFNDNFKVIYYGDLLISNGNLTKGIDYTIYTDPNIGNIFCEFSEDIYSIMKVRESMLKHYKRDIDIKQHINAKEFISEQKWFYLEFALKLIGNDPPINIKNPGLNIAISKFTKQLKEKGYSIVFKSDIIDNLPTIHSIPVKSAKNAEY